MNGMATDRIKRRGAVVAAMGSGARSGKLLSD